MAVTQLAGSGGVLTPEEITSFRTPSTFTPALLFGGANTGMTTTTTNGIYSKVGKLVVFNIRIVLTALGSSTGTATISGLPYAAASTITITPPVNVFANNISTSITVPVSGVIVSGTSAVSLRKFAAGIYSNMADTDFLANSVLTIAGQYFTD